MVNKTREMSDNKTYNDTYKYLEHVQVTRPEFIENLLKAFEKDHTEFIEQLKERGLNEEEIKFCCLEVLGVKG